MKQKKRFGGKEPLDNDVKWSLLNEDIIKNSVKAQWESYRFTRFEMGEILKKEGKLKAALSMYLCVCYLDLNGARDVMLNEDGSIFDPESNKPFSKDLITIAPGVVERIKKIIRKLDLNKEEVKRIFIMSAKREKKATRAPRDLEECFKELRKEI
jgi:hypothetical protein